MPAIYPIVTSRVSDSLIHARLISQFEFDNQELVRLQDQVSTGYRISTPSDDAPAAIRAIVLQRLLEQKSQSKTNLNTTESFVAATDNSLSGATDLMNEIRVLALSSIGTTSSEVQRTATRNEIQQGVHRFLDVANEQFRGRYLFGGSQIKSKPFTQYGNYIRYEGNEISLRNYVDVDYLSDTNINGAAAFGALSTEVRGSVDLNPVVRLDTKISDLRRGEGITLGTIRVSDGTNTSSVDLTGAETVGDVIERIEAHPPAGREVNVTLSGHGLIVDLDDAGGGNLTIREVAGGTTATELGILETNGTGTAPLLGEDTDPRITLKTPLRDLLGTRASARLVSTSVNNDVYLEAARNGAAYNNVQIQFVDVAASGDQAIAAYDSIGNTLTIDISPGVTRASTVVDAINATGDFTARLDDKLDTRNNGSEVVELGATATTSGGSGEHPDFATGLQILNGGATHALTFGSAQTVEDLLNELNESDANVLASINENGNGFDLRSRLSGSDFAIGENGGILARQLGIRSMTGQTYLAELNYSRGVTPIGGVDFVIQRRDGIALDINLSSSETVQDVIDLINNHPDNVGNAVTARLAQFGNGIELEDANSAGTFNVTVTRTNGFAAWELGLVPRDEIQAIAPAAGVGQPQVLTGQDVNPLESPGIFNTLLRLGDAVEQNDPSLIERATSLLDRNFSDLLFVRAELGGKARALETLQDRIETEDIELQATLSNEIDADIIKSISDIAARQANLEASLRLAAQAFQLSLLDFL